MKSLCFWEISDVSDWHVLWVTGCGNTIMFVVQNPMEDNFCFCPFCGKQINGLNQASETNKQE